MGQLDSGLDYVDTISVPEWIVCVMYYACLDVENVHLFTEYIIHVIVDCFKFIKNLHIHFSTMYDVF